MGNENTNVGNIFGAALDSRTNSPCLKKTQNEITYRKVWNVGFVIVNCDLACACSGSNVVDNPEQFISMALPIRKLSADGLFVIVSTLCSTKTVLYPGRNYASFFIEDNS